MGQKILGFILVSIKEFKRCFRQNKPVNDSFFGIFVIVHTVILASLSASGGLLSEIYSCSWIPDNNTRG